MDLIIITWFVTYQNNKNTIIIIKSKLNIFLMRYHKDEWTYASLNMKLIKRSAYTDHLENTSIL